MSIGVILVNDNPILDQAIEIACSSKKDIHLIGRASNFDDLQDIILKTKPRVVLITDKLNSSPLEIIINLMKLAPIPCLLLITDHNIEMDPKHVYALDFGIVDVLEIELSKGIIRHPRIIPIRIGILSKLKLSRFKKQISQVSKSKNSLSKFIVTKTISAIKLNRKTASSDTIKLKKIRQRNYTSSSIIVIAASTGGPKMIVDLISQLPFKFPPIIVIQHMPETFMEVFTNRIDSYANMIVQLGKDGSEVLPNHVYVAPGGKHLIVEKNKAGKIIMLESDSEKVNFVRPAADVTLKSVAKVYQNNAIAVILTGMGSDGRDGCQEIKKYNGKVITLNEKDSVIFGMNQAVIRAGYSDITLGINQIAAQVANWVTSE